MIRRDTTTVRRGLGRRPLTVVRIRRSCPLTRRVARRMRAAGRTAEWIAAALGIKATRVPDLIETGTDIWGNEMREAAE
jgi:hypothetical protein